MLVHCIKTEFGFSLKKEIVCGENEILDVCIKMYQPGQIYQYGLCS